MAIKNKNRPISGIFIYFFSLSANSKNLPLWVKILPLFKFKLYYK